MEGRRWLIVALLAAALGGCGGDSRCFGTPDGDGVRVEVLDEVVAAGVVGYGMSLCVDGAGCRDVTFDGPSAPTQSQNRSVLVGFDGLTLRAGSDIPFAVSVFAPDGRLVAERRGSGEVETWRNDCGRRMLHVTITADGVRDTRENGR